MNTLALTSLTTIQYLIQKKKTVIKRKTYKEMMQSEWKDNKHMNEYNLTNIGYPTYLYIITEIKIVPVVYH